jgi:hypothetical protein
MSEVLQGREGDSIIKVVQVGEESWVVENDVGVCVFLFVGYWDM